LALKLSEHEVKSTLMRFYPGIYRSDGIRMPG